MDCYYCSQVGNAYRVSGIQLYSCTIAHGSSVQLYMMSVDLDLTGCLEESIVVCRVCMLYDSRSYGMSLRLGAAVLRALAGVTMIVSGLAIGCDGRPPIVFLNGQSTCGDPRHMGGARQAARCPYDAAEPSWALHSALTVLQ